MDYLYKILLVGDSGVGKSCIVTRYTDDVFTKNYMSTIGVDFKVCTLDIDNKIIKFQIWDTSGQERFREITNSYYRGVRGVIMVYDVTNIDSWNHINKWYTDIISASGTDTVFMLIANKCDETASRVVSTEVGEDYSKKMGILYNETSALDGTNINEVFTMLGKTLMSKSVSFNASTKVTSVVHRQTAFCCPII
jgi:Ras-related protein Rab-1A